MNDPLILLFYKLFTDRVEKKQDGYGIVKYDIVMSVFYSLYERSVEDKSMVPIEDIEKEKKQLYWTMAKNYYQEKEIAIKASKVIYVLSLLTEPI